MAAKFYVGVNLNGVPQYYQRDSEQMVKGRWCAVPLFTPELSRAVAMPESTALVLVKRLRSLREDPWIQTVEGQQVKPPEDDQPQYIEEMREPVRVTLDDDVAIANSTARWFIARPARTPQGPKWFVHYDLPGRPRGQDTIFSDSAIEALERAKMLHVIDFVEPAPAPVVAPQPVRKSAGPLVRPAERRRQ